MDKEENKLSRRTRVAGVGILLIIPLILIAGMSLWEDRQYLFVSLLILLVIATPFVLIFEERKPRARELVLLATMVAIGVAGRIAFFWLPQFKPVIAVTIITGIALGGESGFLVGAMIGFVSNFYFSQGPHTPWQMFSFGIIGFLAGVLFQKGLLKAKRWPMSIFGFITCFAIFGLIMNPVSVLTYYSGVDLDVSWEMIKLSYLRGIPFDTIQGIATFVFLFFLGEPLIQKLERVKTKYGFYKEDLDYDWED